jgi:leucyl aminopeptidase
MRPWRRLRGAGGKTVEVLNTDAEGRLILGDALWYARHLGATHLVDVATLTGACVVALGRHASGLFGRPDEWVEQVRQAARAAGERCWPMPTWDEYFEQLKSEIADMTNTGGRPGGAVTAALFLKQFAGDGPWAHLDIAGTGWVDDAKAVAAEGSDRHATRTLVELALAWRGTDDAARRSAFGRTRRPHPLRAPRTDGNIDSCCPSSRSSRPFSRSSCRASASPRPNWGWVS